MFFFKSKITRRILTNPILYRRLTSLICPPPPSEPIVTVLDATSSVGVNLALLLKQNSHIKELRLYDEDSDTHPLAEDLNDIDTRTKVVPFTCRCLREAIKGVHLVISTGGCQNKIGQTQRELFDKNLDNVRNAAIFLAEFNPAAVYCIAKPPVEALVPMVSEEYKKAETYDPRKIIGVTTVASMVANTLIAYHLRRDPADVHCPVIGGLSPKTTIPVISQTKPTVEYNSVLTKQESVSVAGVVLLQKIYSKLQDAVANAEETLLSKGAMFCFSKAVAISRFVNLVLKALKGDKKAVECAFVAQTGHIGDFLPYMTSIVKLGSHGVASTHMPKINEFEIARLRAAMPHILENVLLGQTFLHGDFSLPSKFKIKKSCDALLKEKVQECNLRAGIPCSN